MASEEYKESDLSKIVKRLMDEEGFEFGEAVKEAMEQTKNFESKANGGSIGIEVLFGPKRENFIYGGTVFPDGRRGFGGGADMGTVSGTTKGSSANKGLSGGYQGGPKGGYGNTGGGGGGNNNNTPPPVTFLKDNTPDPITFNKVTGKKMLPTDLAIQKQFLNLVKNKGYESGLDTEADDLYEAYRKATGLDNFNQNVLLDSTTNILDKEKDGILKTFVDRNSTITDLDTGKSTKQLMLETPTGLIQRTVRPSGIMENDIAQPFGEPQSLSVDPYSKFAEGGRVGLFMGGPALTGPALGIYNSMKAYQSFTDQEIADAIAQAGYSISTPPPADPPPGDSTPGQGGGGGGGGGDNFSPYNPDPNTIRSVRTDPRIAAANEADIRNRQLTAMGINDPFADEVSLSGAYYDDMPDFDDTPGKQSMFAKAKQGLAGLMNSPLGTAASFALNPAFGAVKGIAKGIGSMMPVNQRAIQENIAGNLGISVNDIGQIVSTGAYDDPSGANVMAGYNLSQMTPETFAKRRATIEKTMSKPGYKGNLQARLDAIAEAERKFNLTQKLKTETVKAKNLEKMKAKEKKTIAKAKKLNPQVYKNLKQQTGQDSFSDYANTKQGKAAYDDSQGQTGMGSCFIAGTKITMADGVLKNIEDVVVGDKVKGHKGNNEVIKLDPTLLGDRKLYSFNDNEHYFFTSEHPFMTEEGWKSIKPEKTKERDGVELYEQLKGELKVGDKLVTDNGSVEVKDIKSKEMNSPEMPLYNFNISNDNSYIADDYVVHNKGGASGCFIKGTLITMLDGTTKPVEQVDLGDEVAVGGKVFAVGRFLNTELYDYKGIKVSGSHMVNEDGTWMRVRDTKHGKSLGDDQNTVYVFGSENRRILINDILFTDYFEIEDQEQLLKEEDKFFDNWKTFANKEDQKNVNTLNAN